MRSMDEVMEPTIFFRDLKEGTLLQSRMSGIWIVYGNNTVGVLGNSTTYPVVDDDVVNPGWTVLGSSKLVSLLFGIKFTI